MHHATLKAAINKYKPLADEGKEEAEVKAAIAADEKKFSEAEVNEIYAALTENENKKTHSVIQKFRDKNNYNLLYNIGDDVSDLDEKRLQTLIEKGLVKQNDE